MREVKIVLNSRINSDFNISMSLTTMIDTEEEAEDAGEWFAGIMAAVARGFAQAGTA
jgi:hypothetical protein